MSITPPTSSAVSGMTRGAFRRVGNVLSKGMLSRAADPMRANRAIDLNLRKMTLMLVALGALAYQHGHEIVNTHGDRKKWMKTLSQAMVSYAIIDNAAGVYPLIGIFKGLYESGKQPDALRKIQEGVKTALTMTLIYTGVQLGTGMREFQHEYDERLVMNFLEEDSVKEWLRKARNNDFGPQAREMAEELSGPANPNSLKSKLKQFYDSLIDASDDAVKRLEAREGKHADNLIKEARADIGSVIQKVNALINEPELLKTLQKENGSITKLATHIRAVEQPHIKLARWGSPIFMSILLGGVIGLPLVRFVNNKIAEHFPQLSKVKPDKWFEPPPPSVQPAGQGHPSKPHMHWKDVGQMIM